MGHDRNPTVRKNRKLKYRFAVPGCTNKFIIEMAQPCHKTAFLNSAQKA